MLTQQTVAGTPSSTMPLPTATLTSSGQYATSKINISCIRSYISLMMRALNQYFVIEQSPKVFLV